MERKTAAEQGRAQEVCFSVCKKQSPDAKERSALGKRSSLLGIGCNLLLAGGKIAVGKLAGSMSVFADGLNNLSDAASSVVTLIGFKLAERPADRKHPYGHARFEYLASLTVAVMILFIGFELAKSSVEKVLHPAAVEFSLLSAAVLIGSILVKTGLMIFYTRAGRKINSSALLAAAQDSRSDVLTTAAVLLASFIEHFTGWKADGIMGCLVSLFILWNGMKLAKETVSPLLGEGAKSGFRRELTDYINSFSLVLGCHDLMVHDYGPGRTYASIHVEFDKDNDIMQCHEIIDEIERECLRRYETHLVIHLDPVITDDAEINRTRQWVEAWLAKQDKRLSMHDFRMHFYEGKTKLVFDMVIPEELQGREEELKNALEQALNRTQVQPDAQLLQEQESGQLQNRKRDYQTDITFDPEAE